MISLDGMSCDFPAPVAPPFMPKQGPNDGSRNANIAILPMRFKPSASPIEVVVLPLPAFVGVMDVTSMSFDFFISDASKAPIFIFAL